MQRGQAFKEYTLLLNSTFSLFYLTNYCKPFGNLKQNSKQLQLKMFALAGNSYL